MLRLYKPSRIRQVTALVFTRLPCYGLPHIRIPCVREQPAIREVRHRYMSVLKVKRHNLTLARHANEAKHGAIKPEHSATPHELFPSPIDAPGHHSTWRVDGAAWVRSKPWCRRAPT